VRASNQNQADDLHSETHNDEDGACSGRTKDDQSGQDDQPACKQQDKTRDFHGLDRAMHHPHAALAVSVALAAKAVQSIISIRCTRISGLRQTRFEKPIPRIKTLHFTGIILPFNLHASGFTFENS
jgi:hypothetical protein